MQVYVINTLKIVPETFPIPLNCGGMSQGSNIDDGYYTKFWFPNDDMTALNQEAIDGAYTAHKWGVILMTAEGDDVIVTVVTDVADITPIIDGVAMPQIPTIDGVATITVTPVNGSFTFDVQELDTQEVTYVG
jgi:hypothetical protein